MPIYVAKINFFRENIVVIAFSELRPGSNERFENSTFYGPFRFLIFFLIGPAAPKPPALHSFCNTMHFQPISCFTVDTIPRPNWMLLRLYWAGGD